MPLCTTHARTSAKRPTATHFVCQLTLHPTQSGQVVRAPREPVEVARGRVGGGVGACGEVEGGDEVGHNKAWREGGRSSRPQASESR